MLRWRLLVAAIIIGPLVGLLVLDFRWNFGTPGIWLWPLVLVIAVLAASEMLSLLRAKDWQPAAWAVYTGTLLVVGAGLVPLFRSALGPAGAAGPSTMPWDWPLGALALSVSLAFIGEMFRYREPGKSVVHVALAVLTIAYVGLLLSFLVALRIHHGNGWGMAAVVSTIFVTKISDTGAYFVGRLCGRHKMSPILSPKKTIEGGIGGLVTACLCAWLFFRWFVPLLAGPDAVVTPWWGCVVYGAVVAVAGACGDLSESLLKRDLERKDSSTWMPGLGGVLDVMDSLLMAAPAAYLCWAAGLVGPS
jgi:phosphatidate cytidylyltransferase